MYKRKSVFRDYIAKELLHCIYIYLRFFLVGIIIYINLYILLMWYKKLRNIKPKIYFETLFELYFRF